MGLNNGGVGEGNRNCDPREFQAVGRDWSELAVVVVEYVYCAVTERVSV